MKPRSIKMCNKFASYVFDFNKMGKNLPPKIFRQFKKTVDQKKSLNPEVAEIIAKEIKKWAESMEATHFTHWFLPLTGLTAEKQNTFLHRNIDGKIVEDFSGKDLTKGEPDASSFPHGGMRSTFEARGYTAWDPSSPVFVVKNSKCCILYIPSVFFGYNGKVLDKKTPLLRSLKLINDISLEILKLFNQNSKWVKNMVGPEQEFFLVMNKDFMSRPDLRTIGRVIFSSRPPKGQQMGDHYFGAIPERVIKFFSDVGQEAFRLGIPIKTRHNEVAPNQYEITPIYEEANICADHNQMLMEILKKIAKRHDMVCLLHEKPFRFFNGSGKHINWSLMDSKGRNILTPGTSKSSRLVFLTFLTGFIIGMNQNSDLLQSVLASPGNELRLGGNEAPPRVISINLGEELNCIIQNLEKFISEKRKKSSMIQFEKFIPPILQDMSDRNRTSPVAFTGNKFEFRMPGASASIAFPIAVINLIIAHGLNNVFKEIKSINNEHKILEKLNDLIQKNIAIVFDGDNYSSDWKIEAKKRGLYIPASIPQTIDRLKAKKNVSLFEKYNILKKDEIEARAKIKIEMYIKTIEMELRVARYMLRAYIIPAALKNQDLLLKAVKDFPLEILNKNPEILDNQYDFILKFTKKINKAMEILSILDEDNEKLKNGNNRNRSKLCSEIIRPHIIEASKIVQKIEERVDRQFWSMPRITDMLFR